MQELTQRLHDLTKKLNNLYDSLPEDEKIRLLLQAHLLDQQTQGNKVETLLNELDVELGFLMAHRKHVYDRNPTRGGKDPRADQLAEFVACVLKRQTDPSLMAIEKTTPPLTLAELFKGISGNLWHKTNRDK